MQKLTVCKRETKEKKKYIKGKLLYIENEWFVDIGKEFVIQLNVNTNRIKNNKGYLLRNNEFIKFIGDNISNYNTSKAYFRYKPGDIVKGNIKFNQFEIK